MRATTTLALAGTLLSACVIEERKFDEDYAREVAAARDDDDTDSTDGNDDAPTEDGAAPSGPSAECRTYCDRAMANCTEEHAIYASDDACLATCALLRSIPLDSEDTNTVQCRSNQAQLARTTGEPDVHCPAAGPGGNSRLTQPDCATNCESYCMLQPLVCGEVMGGDLVLEEAECMRRCAALTDTGNFDVHLDHDANNIQCRLVHLSSGALGPEAAQAHCWHASIAPLPESPCGFPVGVEPTCTEYCRVVDLACNGDLAVYDANSRCMDVCSKFDLGTGQDTTQDTLGCRVYHAYASLGAPGTHCPHASPAGDGHCGVDNCESYCNLAAAQCDEQFLAEFGTEEACLSQCAEIPGAEAESGYNVNEDNSGNTVACRIYHAVAAGSDPDACDAVFGAAPCR